MPEVVNYRFRLRRALKATWTAINDVLFDGEIGWARDTGEMKVGDGATGWNSLPYLERGIHLDRLGDVDPAGKANGKILAWDASTGKHQYVDQSGGGGSVTNPLPDSVIHWLALRQRNGVQAKPTYFASAPVLGVGLGAAAANSNSVQFSETVNGLRGARFNGDYKFTMNPEVSLFDNTIIAVLKTASAAEGGDGSANNIAVGSANGSPQLRALKSGTASYIQVVRSQQALIADDSAFGLIPAESVVCITVLVSANDAVTIRRNGVQTAAATGAAFSQPLTWWGSKNSTEPARSPLLEFALFDRVLSGTALTDAESYFMGIWGIA